MLAKTLCRQVQQIFKTLRVGLENCPENEMSFEPGGLGALAIHALSSVECHFATDEFKAKWDSPVASKQAILRYLNDAREMLLLPYIQTQPLLSDDEWPQYFICKLDRVLKITRHLAHHTGEINAALKSNGHDVGPFV